MLQQSSIQPTLADLSRNASVISTSSSDSSLLKSPLPRPLRTFSAPRSRSPQPPPTYIAQELSYNPQVPSPQKHRSKSRAREATPDDFNFGPTLGSGSYSEVKLATHIRTGHQYAIKVLEKSHLIRKNKMQTALAERKALALLGAGHPGIVRLFYAFQDDWRLYFVIDLARNGEMQTLISRLGSLSVTCARHYAAQLVDAIDYMHNKGIIHRDLKPENLLLTDEWRIKVTDFGTGKILESGVEKAETWVGTAQYVAPELLEAKETSKSSDFWALGCILYQMIAGRFAFQGLSDYLTWQKIKLLEYSFPEGFDEQAKDLVQRLLVKEPHLRLGVGTLDSEIGMQALRSHPFFSTINWETLWTDPVPQLEPGLVRRTPGNNEDTRWEDMDSAWNELVAGDDEDEIEWADHDNGDNEAELAPDIGPLGEARRQPLIRHDTASTIHASTTLIGNPVLDAVSHFQSSPLRESSRPDSLSSSSDGSPHVRVNQMMESLQLHAPQPGPPPVVTPLEAGGRGRNMRLSPVQGNGISSDVNFSALLKLPGEEQISFNSAVEALPLRRRASRLLPLPAPPSKTRQLVLTNRRLVCLKQQHNRGKDEITVKLELFFRTSEKLKEKEKESRGVVISTEQKSEREFVVLTNTKSFTYATKDAELASTWTRKINEALELSKREVIKVRT